MVGANAQAGWLYVIAASFLGVVVAGVIAPAWMLRRVSASREVVPIASVGDQVPILITLMNESRGRRGPLAGIDTLLGRRTFLVEGMAPKETSSIVLDSIASRRGVYERAEFRLETAAPFGIGRAHRSFDLQSSIVIHPRWVPLATFPLLESASTPNEALHERPRRGSGTDFYGLREYRPGDSLRRVHWRSSARSGSLLVREYEEHIGSRMSILIGGAVLGSEPDTSFEASVSCAASLVMYALDSGHPVQLFCPTGPGVAHLFEPGKAEALDWLARLEPDSKTGFVALTQFASSEIFRRSTNVLIFSTDRDSIAEIETAIAALQEIGTRVIAVALSARTFSSGTRLPTEEEEQRLMDKLANMRAIVYFIEHGKDLAECLREPLHV